MSDRTEQPDGIDRELPEEGLLTDEIRPDVVVVAYDTVEAAKLRGEPAKTAAMDIVARALDDELANP